MHIPLSTVHQANLLLFPIAISRYIKKRSTENGGYLEQKQLGPGVLTKSNTEKGGKLTDLVPMSTRRQPSNPRLRLGLLGCHLVDIGMKLHLVHFSVKFSKADLR